MSLNDYKVYRMCANTQNLVHENLVYFQNLNSLAVRWIFSPMHVQFWVKRRTNPVCDIVRLMIPNLVKSSLMGKIQDQSVSTYELDSQFVSQSVLTYSIVCLYSHQRLAFSESCLLGIIAKSYQISWPMTVGWRNFFQLCCCVSFWFWREIGFGFTYLRTQSTIQLWRYVSFLVVAGIVFGVTYVLSV